MGSAGVPDPQLHHRLLKRPAGQKATTKRPAGNAGLVRPPAPQVSESTPSVLLRRKHERQKAFWQL
eukprot:13698561-Alexandrium_andersonii.AAC.1